MSQCKCDLRTKLVGDGCRYCNPQEYIDNLIESLEEQRTWVGLTEKDICEAAVKSQEGISPRDDTLRFAIAIEAKLKEKNA
jgi:hypothetical protein